MQTLNITFRGLATTLALIVLVFAGSTVAAHAQYDGYSFGCDLCGGSDYYGFTPDYYSGSDYYGYTPDYSGSDYYGYTPDYYGSDYYGYTSDYSGSNYYGYTPDYSGSDYYGYTPDYSGSDYYDFTGYDSGYSAAPFFSPTPSFFSEAPFFPPSPFSISAAPIAFSSPIFTQQPVFTPPVFTNPIHITASPTVPVSVAQNQTQTQSQTTPIHISLSPSNPAQPFNISTIQEAAPISVNNSTRVNTPNTNTNNNVIHLPGQPPINITNTNINNNPAPVYPAPVQQLIQYTFPSNHQTPTCSITTSNSYYNSYNNQPVTLSWVSSNAYSATIYPNVGSVNPNGSTTVYPISGTTIYTMTVYGQGGSSTCQTQVVYQQQPVYTPPPSNVSCQIAVQNGSIGNGQSTYLAWDSYGATSASLSDGIGAVGPSGTLAVRPASSRNYTMTVYGQQGQSATCNAYVTVKGHAPSVSLSQIPYTGFDFGTFGNGIYWLSLLSFAVALSYLAVYYRGGLALFATAGTMGMHRADTRQTAVATPSDAKTENVPAAAPARSAAFANLPTREYRSATADAMSIAQAKSADEMPRIIITRS